MTRAFVADASVAIGWVHPAQATGHTGAMLSAIAEGATPEVPALWPLDVANALTVLQRRRKLTGDERQAGLGWLRGLPLRIDHEMALLALLDEMVAIDDEALKVRKEYVKKFGKVLPAKRVARFFQLENKMDAVIKADLAEQIPLVK